MNRLLTLVFLGWLSGSLLSCTSPPLVLPSDNPSPSPSAPAVSPSPSPSPTSAQGKPSTSQPATSVAQKPDAIGKNLTCLGSQHYGEIVWQQGQPRLTFGRQNGTPMLRNAPISVAGYPDGRTIYTFLGETMTTVRINPNSTCQLRVVGDRGITTVNETGRIGTEVGQNPGQQYQQGFDRGYQLGFRDGTNFRRYNTGYYPDRAFQQGAQSGNANYDRGFRDGFYTGFDAGYYATEPSPTPKPEEPNQDNLALTCRGDIQNSVDFTAYYTREAGFSRLELRPRTSTNILQANLTYAEKNSDGEAIWRGSVAGMADVVLIHLSPTAVRRGDQISVGYDGRWGRTTCR